MTDFLGRGWRFPVARDGQARRFSAAEYEESVDEAIQIILSTALGERVMRPSFGCGIHDLVFAPNSAATRGMAEHHVREALMRWEPRIDVLDVRIDSPPEQKNLLLIRIDYRVRSNNAFFNLVYPFFLQEGVQR